MSEALAALVGAYQLHHLVRRGFTWYGSLIGGVVAAVVIVHRHQLPLGAAASAVPLTVAYRPPLT